jgi:hypothetical protein
MRKEILKALRLGDRVDTKFGAGTVVRFEDHSYWYKIMWNQSTFSGDGRIVVALDNPDNWILRCDDNPHPFMMPSDIEKVY